VRITMRRFLGCAGRAEHPCEICRGEIPAALGALGPPAELRINRFACHKHSVI
jgi:hypothetical protein